jgi:hypothetical protein
MKRATVRWIVSMAQLGFRYDTEGFCSWIGSARSLFDIMSRLGTNYRN